MNRTRTTWWASLTLIVAFVAMPLAALAQPTSPTLEDIELHGWGCTSIMVGKLASTDGSVMTAHSCDGNYRTWLQIEPRRTNRPGSMKSIYWGTLHNETPWDMRGVFEKGQIPEVEQTYAYMNVAYPCLNEKQLAIGETTIGGRGELRNTDGLFLIEELQKIVLERCTTAREAIRLIGELVKEYGYGDAGECLTFADPKEVWHFEIMGGGPFEVGAVWAAVRIPDDHVGVSANIPRISTLNLNDPDHYMASENVHSLAQEMGWWDPASGEEFRWWKAYNGRRPYSTREFFILSTMAPELGLTMDMEELPFTVKPAMKVDIRDVLAYYRETYEGTEFDMTKDLMVPTGRRRGQETADQPSMVKSPAVNNWSISGDLANLLNTLKPGSVQSQRAIAIARCSYSQIIQCRDWLPEGLGAIAWFSFDNPGQSPRIPIFSGALELPESFAICGQKRYREDAAVWHFRRANRLAMIHWGSTGPYMQAAIAEFEEKAFNELPAIEAKALELYKAESATGNEDPMVYREFLTRYTNDFARAAMARWWDLGDQFFTMFARGW